MYFNRLFIRSYLKNTFNPLSRCFHYNKMYNNLEIVPPDLHFGPVLDAKNDKHPDKVDLCLGVYRDAEGKPQMFKAVRMAKIAMANDPNEFEEYLPLLGHDLFVNEATDLLFNFEGYSEDDYKKLRSRMISQHALSGTGALFNGLSLLRRCIPAGTAVYTSNPSWVAYESIVIRAGFEYREYPYYNYKDNTVDMKGLLADFETYPENTIVVLQTSCHNPTGLDLSEDEWLKIIDIIKRKQLIAFLDTAYQGFATNNLKKDALPIKLFCDARVNFLLAQSFSKIMSLYSTRTGVLHIVMGEEISDSMNKKIVSNLKQIARSCYSNPPRHGSEIAYRILSNMDLRKTWLDELTSIIGRIISMRQSLYDALLEKKVPGDWSHLIKQRGMFAFLNISKDYVERLKNEHHIHIISNSRVCVAALNDRKIKLLVNALYNVLSN